MSVRTARLKRAPRDFKGAPIVFHRDQAAWEAWLAENGAGSPGVWLRIAKKASGIATVSYEEALEAALCHGWIDGQKQALDEESWLQRFTPRGPKSIWSKRNREKAAALIAAGRMTPAGREAVRLAQADGRWDAAYDSQKGAEVPEDFLAALAKKRKAAAFFAGLDSANRYAFLFRLQTARTAAARARRIALFVAMLGRGETFHAKGDSPL
jgi:uncharacterized protein YdeI (YjbR/CyaY-like superfamily)